MSPKFAVDSYFAIGKTHMVCQDYALAKVSPGPLGHPYVIVADGCSSSPDTDVGARLLVLALDALMPSISGLRNKSEPIDLGVAAMCAHGLARQAFGINPRCLDATLFCAYWTKESDGSEGVAVRLQGDGVVAARRRDGSFELLVVEYPSGAPFYLSYHLDQDRLMGYQIRFGTEAKLRTFDSRTGWSPEERTTTDPQHSATYSSSDFDLVLVMSDGALSFQRAIETNTSRSFESVPVEQVVEQLLAIRSVTGEFLKRRCHRFLTKFCVENRWQHADDFSVAALWIGVPDEQ